jgi:hypothetical protein
MSDIADGAAAPAEAIAAPEVAEIVSPPNPVSSEREPEAKPEPRAEVKTEPKKLSTREALQKAAEKVENDNKPVEAKAEIKTDPKAALKTEAKPEDKTRDETGKFVAKEPKEEAAKPSHTAEDAPARFTETARAKWASADPEIRGETLRMQRELTEGYQKHKASAEAFESYRELDDIAKQAGKRGADVFREYYNMERMLRSNPEQGLAALFERIGIDPKEYAAHILGKPADQVASEGDKTIRELKQTVARLEQQLGGVTQTITQSKQEASLAEVSKFAESRPLFDVLAPHIADHMRESGNTNLEEAYNAVLQKHPTLAALSTTGAKPETKTPAASSAPEPDLTVQTDKGQKSIQGAPSFGSDPKRKPSSSIKESLKRAMAQAG